MGWRRTFCVAAGFLTVVLFGCGGAGEPDSQGASPPGLPVAAKLASLDAQERVEADDPRVKEYDQALARLEEKCGSDRERFGDMAVVAQKKLREEEIEESLLSILRAVRASIPDDAPPGLIGANESCAEVFGTYVFLRTRE